MTKNIVIYVSKNMEESVVVVFLKYLESGRAPLNHKS